MKRIILIALALAVLVAVFTACGPQQTSDEAQVEFVGITLSDDGVLVGGNPASTDASSAVYVSNDIVFYLEGQSADYGEGEMDEAHPQSEADKHTVINITQPGNYMVSGGISRGQIAVNLGKNAENNPDAVVNIILNNAEITCTVAPAIICYSAYECGDANTDTATKDVDTSGAGFNITLADDSFNIIKGSHVAKIYKPGTEDKLHKYDAAIESLVSMNITSENGFLTLVSDNEGIETKMHMTINGGTLNIRSEDDSLNAGEDGVSVITINDGIVWANADIGKEGDGIDSNGWVVINGGTVNAFGNSDSMDSGLDSDMGIYINGGTVLATGNMYDEISKESTQNFAVFNFAQSIYDKSIILKSLDNNSLTLLRGIAKGNILVYSSPQLIEGDYELYFADGYTGGGEAGVFTDISNIVNAVQLAHSGMAGGFGGRQPMDNFKDIPFDGQWLDRPIPDRGTPPQDFGGQKPQFDIEKIHPDGPENHQFNPEDFSSSQNPDFQGDKASATQLVFTIVKGGNNFSGIAEYIAE